METTQPIADFLGRHRGEKIGGLCMLPHWVIDLYPWKLTISPYFDEEEGCYYWNHLEFDKKNHLKTSILGLER